MERCSWSLSDKGLEEDVLFELGLLRRGDDGHVYAMFRHRIMIPIRNRWGRIIAYTARYIGNSPNAPKYVNSPNSAVYAKGECLFGIDRASRERNAEYFIIVEGAPDVLRMQSVGYDNTVAALGTAWTDSQFERLKNTSLHYASSLIPMSVKASPSDRDSKRSWQTEQPLSGKVSM